jgi:hypothetical protein
VAGLPAHASAGNGGAHHRTRRGHPVAVLTAQSLFDAHSRGGRPARPRHPARSRTDHH